MLLDEKSLSDIESEAGRADLESRFPGEKGSWIIKSSCSRQGPPLGHMANTLSSDRLLPPSQLRAVSGVERPETTGRW